MCVEKRPREHVGLKIEKDWFISEPDSEGGCEELQKGIEESFGDLP